MPMTKQMKALEVIKMIKRLNEDDEVEGEIIVMGRRFVGCKLSYDTLPLPFTVDGEIQPRAKYTLTEMMNVIDIMMNEDMINEGTYLQTCNTLKEINDDEVVEVEVVEVFPRSIMRFRLYRSIDDTYYIMDTHDEDVVYQSNNFSSAMQKYMELNRRQLVS